MLPRSQGLWALVFLITEEWCQDSMGDMSYKALTSTIDRGCFIRIKSPYHLGINIIYPMA
jgi:hypothetical protein